MGCIDARATTILGQKFSDEMQAVTIEQCRVGALDTTVCSILLAKNGCNLQGMNWMVSLGWIGRYMDEVQCKGTATYRADDSTDSQVECAELARKRRRSSESFGLRVIRMTRPLNWPTSPA